MSNPNITISGRLAADPELRFTPQGHAVVSLTIATNDRKLNRASGEWEDGDASFWRCTAWRDLAENIAEHLTKGVAVVATGAISQRSWEDKEGNKRVSAEVELTGCGVDLRWKRREQRQQPANDPWGQAQGARPDPWAGAQQPPQQPQGNTPWGQQPQPPQQQTPPPNYGAATPPQQPAQPDPWGQTQTPEPRY